IGHRNIMARLRRRGRQTWAMSGPVRIEDAAAAPTTTGEPAGPEVEITPSRETEVGGMRVRRALPRHGRRTIGAWCFVDHLGPLSVAEDGGIEIGPHPHMGLHT